MDRRLPTLRGLAILAVLLNHSAGWAYTAMFWWTDRYRPGAAVPDYGAIGSPTYIILTLVEQLALFSVPAFLFMSGCFSVYAARGDPPTLSRKVLQTQFKSLLYPYLIWSCVIFAADAIQGQHYVWSEYLRRLLFGDATSAYFFVPLLCQCYLLAPFVIRWAKSRPWALLLGALAIQVGALGLSYLPQLGVALPSLWQRGGWAFIWYAVYFPLGMVYGFHQRGLRPRLARARWVLLGMTVVTAVLLVLETEWLRWRAGDFARAHCGPRISAMLYALCFLLTFLGMDLPKAGRGLQLLSTHSYGIYLLHPKIFELGARLIYHIAPGILAHQALFQPILLSLGLGVPLAAIVLIRRSRWRGIGPFLFG